MASLPSAIATQGKSAATPGSDVGPTAPKLENDFGCRLPYAQGGDVRKAKFNRFFGILRKPTVSPKEGNLGVVLKVERGMERVIFLSVLWIRVVDSLGERYADLVEELVPRSWRTYQQCEPMGRRSAYM